MGWKIATLMLAVMVIGLVIGFTDLMVRSRGMRDSIELLKEDADKIIERIELRDYDGRVRDSVMMLELSASEVRLEKWMVLHAESWKKADAYKDSIDVLRSRRDSLIRTFMEW